MFADAFGSAEQAKLFALAEEMIGLPQALSLSQNYPNPFNSSTIIDYALRSASGVVLEVYDLSGQWVHGVWWITTKTEAVIRYLGTV